MNLSGAVVDRTFMVALGIVAAAVLLLVLRRSPRLAFGMALVALCFVPVWFGFGISPNGNFYVPMSSAVVVVAVLALLPRHRIRLSIMDGVALLLLVVSATSSFFTGNSAVAVAFFATAVVYFTGGYLLGRLAPASVGVMWAYGAVAVVFSVVAFAVILEFVTGFNPFVQLRASNSLYTLWSPLQTRGGIVRAEGAFGHSIALGSSLAMAIPLTLASRFRFPVRATMAGLMLVATVFTFSRAGIIAAVLGLVLCVLFLRGAIGTGTRAVLGGITVVLTTAMLPIVISVFTEAGSEASGSAAYRGDLLSLLQHMNLMGVSDLAHRTAAGELYFDNFQSIDSQLILTGVTEGVLPLLLVVVALVVALVLVVSGRASAATIAVVAQIPSLATVALITQYSTLLWMLAGLATASQLARAEEQYEPAPNRFAPRRLDPASLSIRKMRPRYDSASR
ncbi:hypothetical protein [Parafrigoribacterium soli]|uniref:hypothetical protein n=1 Tax=Parafrigoribacterium soli TaxID=3144663 RepID=UPI0032EB8DC1